MECHLIERAKRLIGVNLGELVFVLMFECYSEDDFRTVYPIFMVKFVGKTMS